MQLQALILFALVLLEGRIPDNSAPDPWMALLAVIAPPAVALILQARAVHRAERYLDDRDRRGSRWAMRAERYADTVRWATVIGLGAATMGFGWVHAIRAQIDNWPALDEIIALLPSIAALALSVWIGEPLERRIREATLVRRLDQGLPIPPAPSRAAFVYARMSTDFFLILAPLVVVLAVGETVEPQVAKRVPPEWREQISEATFFACAAVTYVLSPLIARLVLRLKALPAGELRRDLLEVCHGAGVRVSQVFLWNTHYASVNGAVMGIVAPLRFVMLTDALLELLPRDQLRAVMAHEVGHVRRRHLTWMLGALISLITFMSFVIEWPLRFLYSFGVAHGMPDNDAMQTWALRGGVAAAAGLAMFCFGWVSRRYERQADTFAAQHLSTAAGSQLVTPGAVDAMRSALASVALFNGVDPEKRSWRHGSIAWRRAYLARLVGQPIDRLGIDRLVRVIKIVTLFALMGVGILLWYSVVNPEVGAGYDQPVATTNLRADTCAS